MNNIKENKKQARALKLEEKRKARELKLEEKRKEKLLKESKIEFKSAKVPFRVCLKLALKNIWKKKFRFLTIILICSISLAFLSFTIELNGDKLRQNVYTMIENGYNYTTIQEHLPLDDEALKENYYNKFNSVNLSSNSYEKIKNEIPELVAHKYEEVNIKYAGKEIEIKTDFYPGYINTLIQYDKNNEYTLLAGRLPNENEKEILITDYLVSAFNFYNIIMDDGTYFDYLNKTIKLSVNDDYKIVGVIDTNFETWISYSGFKELDIDESNKENYSFYSDFIFMNAIVIPTKYFQVEKVDLSGNLEFTKSGENRSEWLINFESSEIIKNYLPETLSFRCDDLPIAYKVSRRRTQYFGNAPTSADEIAIPTGWLSDLFGITFSELSYNDFKSDILNSSLSITLTPADKTDSFNKTFKIVGLVDSENMIYVHEDTIDSLTSFTRETDKILVELPKNPDEAYKLFNKAYDNGYVINVWGYRTDIDSYTIDPFIDIISKAGLIVFLAFTIGIMWTIITIEIVDSKKEIGILRSIGLSGFKVSLIFIIQALFICLIAYIISLFLANFVITYYNSGITDELGVITLYMYTMTYRTPLYLIIFVILISFISTIVPLLKIMSQKIIDVINERE